MIQTAHDGQLTFDPQKHVYRLGGFVIPSVTQLMKPLSNAAYGDIDRAVLDRAAAKGTAVHEAVEFYAKYRAKECEPEYQPYFDAFLRWVEKEQPVFRESERMTYHKSLLYAGTLDLLAVVGGKVTLIDVKTTATVHRKLWRVQLEAYERMQDSHGIGVDQKAILHLKRDGSYGFYVEPSHDVEAWGVFTALQKIWNY